jgi:N-acetylneuraminic acid mutarotase
MNTRRLAAALLLVVGHGFTGSALADEIGDRLAIERVYYSHQSGVSVPFDMAVPRELVGLRVRESRAATLRVEARLLRSLDREMLARERRRIEAASAFPDRLAEMYAALGNDARRIEAALIRPTLAARVEGWLTSGVKQDEVIRRLERQPGSEGTLSSAFGGCAPDDAWQLQPNGPAGRSGATAVWTGSLLIVWGGAGAEAAGRRYDPTLDLEMPMSVTGQPSVRSRHSAVWTGSVMIVWGGFENGTNATLGDGRRYDPIADAWSPVAASPLAARFSHIAVWTGSRMIVWGGMRVRNLQEPYENAYFRSGASYDPGADSWTPIAQGPTGRVRMASAWSGTELIVWGGYQQVTADALQNIYYNNYPQDGSRFDPVAGTWTALPTAGAPSGRSVATSVWMGGQLLVWGGRKNPVLQPFTAPDDPHGSTYYNDGARYDRAKNRWFPVASTGAPPARASAPAVWTGSLAIVWGGSNDNVSGTVLLDTGGRYNPLEDSWTPTTMTSAPIAQSPFACWTGAEMLIWGGLVGERQVGLYDPSVSPDGDDDGQPDACDDCPSDAGNDVDVDGVCYLGDNCRTTPNANQADEDGDGVGTVCDLCPTVADPAQVDTDADGRGDACDTCPVDPLNDVDGDTVCGNVDNCPTVGNVSQTNTDGDAWGNACDNCPNTFQFQQLDGDFDGVGWECDNCQTKPNELQRNTDGDALGDVCDDCPFNSSVVDTDNDLLADACDCMPSDRFARTPPETTGVKAARSGNDILLSWPDGIADANSVMRGLISELKTGQLGACYAEGILNAFSTPWQDSSLPPLGDGFFYLVQGQQMDCGMGTLGFNSAELQRTNAASACTGTPHVDVFPSSEQTIAGTVSGGLASLNANDDVYETITEVVSSGGPPGQRTSLLEQRWFLTVPANRRLTLRVEGFYGNQDDSIGFDCSYDDGAFFFGCAQIGQSEAPFGGFPYNLTPFTGQVTIRAIDSNRDWGEQVLDFVSVDRLFLRAIP